MTSLRSTRDSSGDWQSRSFWLEDRSYKPARRLAGDEMADVVIVGAGFTGLWSAILLKDADPDIDVVVVEQKVAGYGATGRNGGFAMTMVGRSIHDLLRKVGPESAKATHMAMRKALREIESFCAGEGIDASITHPGLLTVSNGPEQDVRIHQDLLAAERLELDDFHEVPRARCRELIHSDRLRMGHFEDDALLVDPAALVRGLRDAAISRGVRIYEMTPVDGVEDIDGRRVEARTPFGAVHADRAVLATNAYASSAPALSRFIFTIYAYIILTEPLTDEQWSRIGWEQRMGVEDKRIMPHFHRPTADGRILWGGRDAPLLAGPPDPARDSDPRIFRRLEETFRLTFPQLADVPLQHAWGGPVAGTVACIPHAGWLDQGRILYALGYSGHGVGPSALMAKVVRDLLLDRESLLTRLPLVTRRLTPLPPPPLQERVLQLSQRTLQAADDRGAARGPLARIALKFLQ